jgi:hypothetical protein
MFGASVVYSGFVAVAAGVALLLRRRTRGRGAALLLGGLAIALAGLLLPAPENRRKTISSRLDEIMPVWQFDERHTRRVAAPPERVFAAIREVRADEIRLFGLLTWIRRGGRDLPESILNAGDRPLLDVATSSGFMALADDPPREVVIGTAVVRPRRRGEVTREMFAAVPRGYVLGAMNFAVASDGAGGSIVTTETRVCANGPVAMRRFRAYWRIIYPGSALIRRMWLRAVERRAMA